MLLVDVRPKNDFCPEDFLAKAALVKFRRLVRDLKVLPPRRHVLEEQVANGAPAAAVRIGTKVLLYLIKLCNKKQNKWKSY